MDPDAKLCLLQRDVVVEQEARDLGNDSMAAERRAVEENPATLREGGPSQEPCGQPPSDKELEWI
jgi:hypothetical protein